MIPTLPIAPSRGRPATFAAEADALLSALDPWATEVNNTATDVTVTADIVAALAMSMALPNYAGTSTTSLTIGIGSKVFVTQSGKSWVVGQLVIATNGNSYMKGVVSAYAGSNLTVNVTSTSGSGTLASWAIGLTLESLSFGGATGGASDKRFYLNDTTMTESFEIPAGKNGVTVGPLPVPTGKTLTVATGSRLVIL